MGASSDTSSFLAEQTLLELRAIPPTVERLALPIAKLPSEVIRERTARSNERLGSS